MKAKFLLDGQEVTPNNYEELAISLNFDADNPTARVGVNEWEFGVGSKTSTDGANLSNIHIKDGLNNGVGVFEGKPFQIYVNNDLVFDGYLDLSTATISCEKVIAEAIESADIDWLNLVADSFNIELLVDPKLPTKSRINPLSDYIPIPYVISEVPDIKNTILTILTTTSVTIQLSDQLQTLIEHLVSASNPFEGTGAIRVALRIAYIVSLIAILINLIKQVFNLIIQPIKYHYAMNVKTLCEKGAAYLGMNFESDILNSSSYKNMVIIPEKYEQEVNDDKDGVYGTLEPNLLDAIKSKAFYKGTFGDLLRQLKLMFKAKVFITGNTIKLIREDKATSQSTYQIPPIDIEEYSFNAEEFYANYNLSFSTDANDKNTIQEYTGTELIVHTIPKKIVNKTMVLSKGNEKIKINFALAKRKRTLSIPEKIFKAFFKSLDAVLGAITKVVNSVIRAINKVIRLINKIKKALKTIGINWNIKAKRLKPLRLTSLASLIEDRIGMLKMENDFVTVPKILVIDKASNPRYTKIAGNNESVLSADILWNKFHSISSFDSEQYADHNQHIKKTISVTNFCYEDYLKVKNNNFIYDSDGVSKGRIDLLEWNPIQETARIDYRINQVYTKNLKTVKIIPNGR